MRRDPSTWLGTVLVSLLAMTGQPARAEVVREIDLTREFADVTVLGPGDGSMRTVATGDVNGDGFVDLLLGVYGGGTSTRAAVGAVSVKFGPLEAGFYDLRESYAEFIISVEGGCCRLGYEIVTGDLNGDGIKDIATLAGHRGQPGQSVHVVFGSPALGGHLDLAERQADLTIRSVDAEDLAVGDFNGDGIEDLAMRASLPGQPRGSVFVLFGSTELEGTIDLSLGYPGFVIIGHDTSYITTFGTMLAAGDVNGDGIDDLMLGGPDDSSPQVEVIFGAPDLSGTRDLRMESSDFRVIGGSYGFGAGLVSDDFDGDGIQDLAMDSPFESFGAREFAGEVFVIRGKPDLGGVHDLREQPAELTVVGAGEQHFLGNHHSPLENRLSSGDVDGDGIADLVVPAPVVPSAPGELFLSGECYAIFGGPDVFGVRDLAIEPAEIIVHGGGWRDYLGWATAAGDVDGDSVDDVIFMAPRGAGIDDARYAAGEAHIIFGQGRTPEPYELLEAVQALPEDAFVLPGSGQRQAMLGHARSIVKMLDSGHPAGALRLLEKMERYLGRCGGELRPNDALLSCVARVELRSIVRPLRKATEKSLQ